MVMDITGRPTGMSRLHRDLTPMLSCNYVCCVGATEFGGSVQESCNRRWRPHSASRVDLPLKRPCHPTLHLTSGVRQAQNETITVRPTLGSIYCSYVTQL